MINFRNFFLEHVNVICGIYLFILGIIYLAVSNELAGFTFLVFFGFVSTFFLKPSDFDFSWTFRR